MTSEWTPTLLPGSSLLRRGANDSDQAEAAIADSGVRQSKSRKMHSRAKTKAKDYAGYSVVGTIETHRQACNQKSAKSCLSTAESILS